MSRRLGGPELHRTVIAYCNKTGTSVRAITDVAKVSRSVFDKLPHRAFPIQSIEDRLCGAMALNPNGIERAMTPSIADPHAGAAAVERARERSLAAQIEAETREAAHRRYLARADGQEPLPILRDASLRERVATFCVETPGDLIRTVERQWPHLWSRTVQAARETGTMPGAMLVALIERGLETESR